MEICILTISRTLTFPDVEIYILTISRTLTFPDVEIPFQRLK
jgi:hypothetical protein